MLYVYAVCRGADPEMLGSGLEGRPLRAVRAGGLVAVVSDLEAGRPGTDEESLWTHEDVVERLMACGPALPMRFGSVLDDEAAVTDLLRGRAREFEDALERVTGAVELGVRAAWSADSVSDDGQGRGSGAEYMQGLLNRRRRADDLAARIDAPLSALSRDSRQRLLATPQLPLSGSYLVELAHLEAFRARVATLDEEIDGAEIICTGPWPPYSFVGAGEQARR